MRIDLGIRLTSLPIIGIVSRLFGNLLKEDGGFLLLEDGSALLLE